MISKRKKYIDPWLVTLDKINILLAWVNAMILDRCNLMVERITDLWGMYHPPFDTLKIGISTDDVKLKLHR